MSDEKNPVRREGRNTPDFFPPLHVWDAPDFFPPMPAGTVIRTEGGRKLVPAVYAKALEEARNAWTLAFGTAIVPGGPFIVPSADDVKPDHIV